jgi:hypothetical protein
VAVNEYHRHCPYCGHDLRRKVSVRHKNLALWQAALIGLAFALLVSFWAVFNGVYFERELPIRFIIGFLSGTVLAYLLGNACLYLLRRYRDKE